MEEVKGWFVLIGIWKEENDFNKLRMGIFSLLMSILLETDESAFSNDLFGIVKSFLFSSKCLNYLQDSINEPRFWSDAF